MPLAIVHVLPQNSKPCGGIKVHYQLSELEQLMGHKSFVAFPTVTDPPLWFNHNCQVITYDDAKQWKPDVVIGWKNPEFLIQNFPDAKKVAYIQGESLVNKLDGPTYKQVDIWYSSKWNQKQCTAFGFSSGKLVQPYIDLERFHPLLYHRPSRPVVEVMVLARKNGMKCWDWVWNRLSPNGQARLRTVEWLDSDEKLYAERLRECEIVFVSSYPEGLGLVGLEAMASKTVVVGFTGGGGTDYMKDKANCFIAPDGDVGRVAQILDELVSGKNRNEFDAKVNVIRNNGYSMVAREFTRLKTQKQLKEALVPYEKKV